MHNGLLPAPSGSDWSSSGVARDGRGTPTQASWLEDHGSDERLYLPPGLDSRPFAEQWASTSVQTSQTLRGDDWDGRVGEADTIPSRDSLPDPMWARERLAFPDARPLRRQTSTRSSLHPSIRSNGRPSADLSSSWADQPQAPSAWVERKLQIHQSHRNDPYDDTSSFMPDSQYDEEEEEWDEEEEAEVDESRFFNRALLSEMALQVKDKVNKSRHTKAGIAWVGSFTGRDIVVSCM